MRLELRGLVTALSVTTAAVFGTNWQTPFARCEERAPMKMKVKIGTTVFAASLRDNATAAAFASRFPVVLEMQDLNANEKHQRLPSDLPTNAAKPGTIHAGDLMLYGSNTLVLFYKTFQTPYAYTAIGRVDDTSRLAEAVGGGSVTVTFE